MKLRNIMATAIFCLSATSAQASTVFTPTSGDVNFFMMDPLSYMLGGYTLGLFDNDDMNDMANAAYLDIPMNSLVNFSSVGGYSASNSMGLISLSGASDFVLGLSSDAGNSWLADSSVAELGGNMIQVSFGSTNILTIDVAINTTPTFIETNPVPVPAAVWLFATGLLGLVSVARRRS